MPEAKQKTIANQFHESLAAASTNEEEQMYAAPRNTGVGLFGKLQRVMHHEKEMHTYFLNKLPHEGCSFDWLEIKIGQDEVTSFHFSYCACFACGLPCAESCSCGECFNGWAFSYRTVTRDNDEPQPHGKTCCNCNKPMWLQGFCDCFQNPWTRVGSSDSRRNNIPSSGSAANWESNPNFPLTIEMTPTDMNATNFPPMPNSSRPFRTTATAGECRKPMCQRRFHECYQDNVECSSGGPRFTNASDGKECNVYKKPDILQEVGSITFPEFNESIPDASSATNVPPN